MAWKDNNTERHREYMKEHYRRNRDVYIARAALGREKRRQYVHDLKSSTPCTDCKVSYPYCVMDFDHRVQSDKVKDIHAIMSKGWATLLGEIAKCDIVCANCHRERTQRQLDVRKTSLAS